MAGVCIECCVDLQCVVQQTLLLVPDSITVWELFRKEVASKLVSRNCLENLLAMSVSLTNKQE